MVRVFAPHCCSEVKTIFYFSKALKTIDDTPTLGYIFRKQQRNVFFIWLRFSQMIKTDSSFEHNFTQVMKMPLTDHGEISNLNAKSSNNSVSLSFIKVIKNSSSYLSFLGGPVLLRRKPQHCCRGVRFFGLSLSVFFTTSPKLHDFSFRWEIVEQVLKRFEPV